MEKYFTIPGKKQTPGGFMDIRQRSYPRKILQGELQVSSDGQIHVFQLTDISVLGVTAYSDACTPGVGDACVLTFFIPYQSNLHEITVTATVIHCRYNTANKRFRIGLRFNNIDGDVSSLIDSYLASSSQETSWQISQ